MHIGINALFQAHGGSLANLKNLLIEWNRMEKYRRLRVTIYASNHVATQLRPYLQGHEYIRLLEQADRGLWSRTWVEQQVLPALLRRDKVDVLFCPANTLPFRTKVPTVVTFQNAAPFCPHVSLQSVGLSTWIRLRLLRRFIRLSARKATRIIFISEFFQLLLHQQSHVSCKKGEVIYRARQGTPARGRTSYDVHERYRIRQPFVLCVSHLYPYKNILELIQAHLLTTENADIDAQLVVAGGGLLSAYETEIRQHLQFHSVDDSRISLLGAIPPEHVEALLRSAEVFAFPSTCENCPTSLIEALSAGLPIVCSNVGVMPEIAGSAALYFDPLDVADIAHALTRVLRDGELRAELRKRSRMRAQHFPTAEEVALRTLAVIEDASTGQNRRFYSKRAAPEE
jgi:glycosyltransferase involved in cell wall biosynthesis